jgi:pyridoxal phosphate enzyme (YggS family)
MSISQNIQDLRTKIPPHVTLVAVSKTYPSEIVQQAYHAGQRIFGENRVQEMQEKYDQLPKDIEWHLIGHLQTNKVKYIASFVSLIHSVDSLKLLQEIDKQAKKNNRVIDCLLQIYIAKEETKFGLDFAEAEALLTAEEFRLLHHIRITGLMGMATNTDDTGQVRNEFHSLKLFFEKIRGTPFQNPTVNLHHLSMGMTSDHSIAIQEGSTMVRIGSAIFGTRHSG